VDAEKVNPAGVLVPGKRAVHGFILLLLHVFILVVCGYSIDFMEFGRIRGTLGTGS
jgi:hypothetical protein